MKQTILFFFLLAVNICFAQNYNWITPNKDYLKLYVSEDGFYRINKSDFTNAGVSTSMIDPRTVKVFYKGNQVPIYFYGENDGVFNDTDYFDFYGQRNYGGLTNTYKETAGTGGSVTVIDYVTDEYYDFYSDTSAYWVGWDGAYGLRFTDYNNTSSADYPYGYTNERLHFEKDIAYSMGETVNMDVDFRYFNTEKVSGEGWYWKSMSRGNFVSDTFSTPLVSPVPQTCTIKLFAYPNSYKQDTINEHKLIVRINSTVIDTLYRTHYARFDTSITFSSSLLSSSSVNQVTITYTNAGNYAGNLWFDYFRVYYPKIFTFYDNRLGITGLASDTTAARYKVKGLTGSNISIYDIKNGLRITNYSSSSDTLIFYGKANGNYEVINKYITKKPFRIKRKQVPDFLSASNGADYLVIYNKLFESSAEQLRAFRYSHDNFRSYKADVEDIFDVFNYGMESPVAIKNFIKYVYTNWLTPSVKYVCLFGRGSLDPKNNLGYSTFYKNLVPVYGNPTSDGYYVNFNPNSFVYYPQISIGRLPAYTYQEAQDIVSKIINYENNQPGYWVKKFSFITGGFNRQDQQQFMTASENLVNAYINPAPLTGYVQRIYRTDTTGQVSYSFEDSIKNTFNRGTLIVNYIGHAATSTWDNGISDPNILSNGSLNPFIFSMTCYTGKNAQTDSLGRGFGEKFVYLPNKGAIGFVGTTGWSYFPGGGNTLNGYLYKSIAYDSLRRIGDIMRSGQNYMQLLDTGSFIGKNTINSYNLLGDPAAKLPLARYPEFDIQLTDYKLNPVFPSLREAIALTIYPKNFGTHADSCKIRFQLLKNNVNSRILDTVVRNFDFVDTITYNFRIDSAGIYSVKITLDVDNWYTEESQTNNSIVIPIPLKNISFVPLKPIDNSIVQTDSVILVGINPNIDPKKNNVKVYIQFDTSSGFNSPVRQMYYKTCDTGVITKFIVNIPFKDTNVVYFWRTNSVINNTDSSGWTYASRFLYSSSNKITGKISFRIGGDSSVTIYKKQSSQYYPYEVYNTFFSSDGVRISGFTGDLLAWGWGGDPDQASKFRVNGKEILLLDPSLNWSGLNILKVRKTDGVISEYKHFKFSSPSSSDSVINFLNTFNSNYILMAVKSYVFSGVTDSVRQALKSKFRQFGSTRIDSVKLISYDRWSFISYPTETGYSTSEAYLYSGSPNGPAVSTMAPQFRYDSAYVINNLGPVAFYRGIGWNKLINPNTSILSDIYGIDKNNQYSLIYPNIGSDYYFGLDTLKSSSYPNLMLKTKLLMDTLINTSSPVLKSIKFDYVPPAEIISDNYSFIKSDSVVQEGDTVRVGVRYYNVGFIGTQTTINTWSASSPSGIKVIKVDTLNSYIPVEGSVRSEILINTYGLRNISKPRDTVFIYFESKLKTTENEFFTYNNTAITSVIVTGDSIKPELNVTYDGMKVNTGDYIQSKPLINIKYLDDGKIQIRDTSNIKVYLDTNYVMYYIGGMKNPDIDIVFPAGKNLQATVIYKPTLKDGVHDFMYVAYDKSFNYADTVRYQLIVNPVMKISDLYLYPNPMKTQANFVFNLSGSTIPNRCKIKIYTVAGRLVKTINFIANIGYNQVPWDSRDDDGDYMANGVYLYRLIIDGNSSKEASTQKLVILR